MTTLTTSRIGGGGPPLLTGYLIHTKNPGFLGDRGYVIYSKKSRILERGYLKGGGRYSQLGGSLNSLAHENKLKVDGSVRSLIIGFAL